MNTTSTEKSYNKLADTYESRWEGYLNHTHSKFLSRLETEPGERILDPSCGTGMLAEEILKIGYPFKELVLNDYAEKMLEIVRNRLPDLPGISYSHSPVENLSFENETFSLILCLNAFHHYKDQEKAVKEFDRILKPGGELLLLDWNREGLFKIINTIIKWYVPEVINTRTAVEMEKLLRSHNFHILKLDTWRYRYWNLFFLRAHKKE